MTFIGSDPLERAVVAHLADRRDDLCALLGDLIAFDTRAPEADLEPRDETALQDYVAERLHGAGMDVRSWEPEAAELPASRYPISPAHHFRGRPQLVAIASGSGGGRRLLLNGHIDVVTPEPLGAWTSPPFVPTLRDGYLFGRGACDMKGGVAAMIAAVVALLELRVPLRGDLVVSTVTDEESTGAGSLAVAAAGLRADGGLIPEPTGLALWLGTRGSLLPRITVEGRPGHAGLRAQPWQEGGAVNAIDKLRIVLDTLDRIRGGWQERPDCRHEVLTTGDIVPVRIEAGEWLVSVPADAAVECHVQYVPAQADAAGYGTNVEREIESGVLHACAQDPWLSAHPPRFEWRGDVPPGWVDPNSPIVCCTRDGIAALGGIARVSERTTFFDGPTFSRAGIPTIAFGPGDIQHAHAPDERVQVDELVCAAQVIAVTAMRFCGVSA